MSEALFNEAAAGADDAAQEVPARRVESHFPPLPKFHKACRACGKPVHLKHRRCEGCGALSPWPPPKEGRDHRAPIDDQDEVAAFQVGEVYERHQSEQYIGVTDPGALPHVAARELRCMVGSMFVVVPAGKVITDAHMIRSLLAAGQPIVPTGEVNDVVACPCCGEMFRLPPRLRPVQ